MSGITAKISKPGISVRLLDHLQFRVKNVGDAVFKWDVKHFSDLSNSKNNSNRFVKSPEFKCGGYTFQIEMYPRNHHGDKFYVGANLYCIDTYDKHHHGWTLPVTFAMGVCNPSDPSVMVHQVGYNYESKSNWTEFSPVAKYWSLQRLVSHDTIKSDNPKERILENDCLTVFCVLKVYNMVNNVCLYLKKIPNNNALSSVPSDVTIIESTMKSLQKVAHPSQLSSGNNIHASKTSLNRENYPLLTAQQLDALMKESQQGHVKSKARVDSTLSETKDVLLNKHKMDEDANRDKTKESQEELVHAEQKKFHEQYLLKLASTESLALKEVQIKNETQVILAEMEQGTKQMELDLRLEMKRNEVEGEKRVDEVVERCKVASQLISQGVAPAQILVFLQNMFGLEIADD